MWEKRRDRNAIETDLSNTDDTVDRSDGNRPTAPKIDRRTLLQSSLALAAVPAFAYGGSAMASGNRQGAHARNEYGQRTLLDGSIVPNGKNGTPSLVRVARFGVVHDDRIAASDNVRALQNAIDAAIDGNFALDLGNGAIFIDNVITVSDRVTIIGRGNTYWPHSSAARRSKNLDTVLPSPSQIILTNTGRRNLEIFGVTSMQASGADRYNPSAQGHRYNDRIYRLLSFVEESNGKPPKKKRFNAGIHLKPEAGGSVLSGFRVVLDAGGEDGLDGYFGEYSADVPWCSGFSDWDIGLYNESSASVTMNDVQLVGPYKMAGHMLLTTPAQGKWKGSRFPSSPYRCHYQNCVFEGYKALSIRGYDQFQIANITPTSLDVAWADDHPFPKKGRVFLGKHQYGTKKVRYRNAKRVRGNRELLRLSGLDKNMTSQFSPGDSVTFGRQGGSSGVRFVGCRFGGAHHPSGYPCHYKGLEDPMPHPGGGIEISGFKITEISFLECEIQHNEQIGFHLHDCREIYFSETTQAEGNRPTGDKKSGLRFIASPHHSENSHADYPAGDTFNIHLESSDMIFGDHNDFRPLVPIIKPGRWGGEQDNGLFDPNYSRINQWAIYSNLRDGVGIRPSPGGKVGFLKSTPPKSGNRLPKSHAPDWAVCYVEKTERMKIGGSGDPKELQHMEASGKASDLDGLRITAFRPHITLEDKTRESDDFQMWADGGKWSLLAGSLQETDKLSTPLLDANEKAVSSHVPLRPSVDARLDLGTSSNRWDDIYSANGVIRTSDEEEKSDIEQIPDAWLDAWASVDFVRFHWARSIEKKGARARWHVGLVAQRVKKAFEDKGINPFEIGILCYDENREGGRYGIRYDQALAMECALLRRFIKS